MSVAGLLFIVIASAASGFFGLLLFEGSTQHVVMAQIALLSAFCWLGAYVIYRDIHLKRSQPTAQAGDSAAEISSSQDENKPVNANSFMLTSLNVTALFAIVMLLFFIVLVISIFDLLLLFIIVAPFVLIFPLSYLAYNAFQRPLRIERLRRDFELLAAQWDEKLFQQSQGYFNYLLHIFFAMLVAVLGLFILFAPMQMTSREVLEFEKTTVTTAGEGTDQFQGVNRVITEYFGSLPVSNLQLRSEVLHAMGLGFLGGFLFSVYLIYRRYTMYDLLPYVYLYCAVSMLAGLIFNYVAFGALLRLNTNGETEPAVGSLIDILSFALGFFPILALQWLTRTAYSALGQPRRRSDILPLDQIDGISQLHEVRLRDHGIDDAQNLAATDIPMLLINTTFSAQMVVDWVDQAILMVQLRAGEIEGFRQAHIRTITDFRDL